jgi:hypothetical protein
MLTPGKFVNSLGLFFDLIGITAFFLRDHRALWKNSGGKARFYAPTEEEAQREQRIIRLFFLSLILGFSLQLASNFME